MKKKLILIISILSLAFLLSSCGKLSGLPTIVNLEDSIKEIISSKGDNYDFLNDELYLEKMNQLVNKFVEKDIIESDSFVFENLDKDNIPEVIVFRQRNIEDPEDTGYLEVYSFNGDQYALLDRVSMNYDNENYNLKAGKISEDQKGIYLSNTVGKGFGVNYGFILKDGKLNSILNDKKLNLISIETINKIEDINDDGILNFSIYTIDPECGEEKIQDKDKLLLWYKWDGENSGELVEMKKIKVNNNESLNSNEDILKTAQSIIKDEKSSFVNYALENLESLSKDDLTRLLKDHISNLNSKVTIASFNLEDLYRDYKIPLDMINDKEYILSEDTINLEENIKKDITSKLNSGYKIELLEKEYIYTVNYEKLLEKFGEHISHEYRDYLRIQNLHIQKDLGFKKLMKKISIMESFLLTYPYSEFLDEVKNILKDDMNNFLESLDKTPLNGDDMEFIEEYYPHTYLYENLK